MMEYDDNYGTGRPDSRDGHPGVPAPLSYAERYATPELVPASTNAKDLDGMPGPRRLLEVCETATRSCALSRALGKMKCPARHCATTGAAMC